MPLCAEFKHLAIRLELESRQTGTIRVLREMPDAGAGNRSVGIVGTRSNRSGRGARAMRELELAQILRNEAKSAAIWIAHSV